MMKKMGEEDEMFHKSHLSGYGWSAALLIPLVLGGRIAMAQSSNLIRNPGFEAVRGTISSDWETWAPRAEIAGWSAASLLVVVGPPLLGVVLMSLYDFSKMRKD